jgi:hypothetical protein
MPVQRLRPITPGSPDVKRVEELLAETHIPITHSRMNTGVGMSMPLGRVYNRIHTHQMNASRFDAKFPELKRAIWALGHRIVPFRFTTVQVNYNYKTKTHIDKNNIGDSVIVGLGDYTGGALMVEGTPYNIKYHPLMFNGAEMEHGTSAYTGNRYSLVFFRTKEMGRNKRPQ